MAAERQFLDRTTSARDRGVENRAVDYTPYRQPGPRRQPADNPFEIHPPSRWEWLQDCDVFDSKVQRLAALEKDLLAAPSGPATEATKRIRDALGEEVARERSRKVALSRDEFEHERVALPLILENGRAEVEQFRSAVNESFAGHGRGVLATRALGGLIEGGGKSVSADPVAGIGMAIGVIATFLERIEKTELRLAQQHWREIEGQLLSRVEVWKQASERSFEYYAARGKERLDEFNSAIQTCAFTVDALQAEYERWLKHQATMSDDLLVTPLRVAIDDLERRLRTPQRFPRGTIPAGEKGLDDAAVGVSPYKHARAQAAARSKTYSIRAAFEWEWFQNCAVFDAGVARLKTLETDLQADPANTVKRAQRDALAESLTEDLYAINGLSLQELLYQSQAFPSIMVDAQQLMNDFRNEVDEHFARESLGWVTTEAVVGLTESLGKAVGFRPLEGISGATGAIIRFLKDSEAIDRAIAQQQWQNIKRTLESSAQTWREALKGAFDVYQDNAHRHMQLFTSGRALCTVTVDHLTEEYNKWLKRSDELTRETLVRAIELTADELRRGMLLRR